MKRSAIVVGILALVGLSVCAAAKAEEEESAHRYSGDLLSRSTLTGDWGGLRNDWAEKGVTFDANLTQIEQGVVSGGKNGSWEYGGRGDITANLDTQKAGLWPGGFLTVELEGNWSSSVNGKTGALSPANTNQLFPLPTGDNAALPNLSFAQFLSHYFGVAVGKFQTVTTGDANEFAHGKGDAQFFNLAFNINPSVLVVPYSTLGAGVIVLPTADPNQAVVSLLALSATGKASTSGFDNLNGAIFAGEGRVRTGFFGLSGHQLLGALYSNKRYTSLDQRLGFVIENRALATQDGTWAMYYNFDQFLYETDKAAGHGIGLFGRFGASEGDPIPTQYFYSAGVGAKGLIPSRDHDQFGLGYYYSSINNPTIVFSPRRPPLSALRDEWGFEGYYNVALTPWLLLTPDVQVIGPAQKQQIISLRDRRSVGTATVLGLRLQTIF
ncbi:MAG TPA: carbohydrate porin [Candidatus Margulisiibacteriota bacterium]|nr:carbohydrate porin [Candidatus Margulisiibacteriota bacterium]